MFLGAISIREISQQLQAGEVDTNQKELYTTRLGVVQQMGQYGECKK